MWHRDKDHARDLFWFLWTPMLFLNVWIDKRGMACWTPLLSTWTPYRYRPSPCISNLYPKGTLFVVKRFRAVRHLSVLLVWNSGPGICQRYVDDICRCIIQPVPPRHQSFFAIDAVNSDPWDHIDNKTAVSKTIRHIEFIQEHEISCRRPHNVHSRGPCSFRLPLRASTCIYL